MFAIAFKIVINFLTLNLKKNKNKNYCTRFSSCKIMFLVTLKFSVHSPPPKLINITNDTIDKWINQIQY